MSSRTFSPEPTCQRDGCHADASIYTAYNSDTNQEDRLTLCTEHAVELGFCAGCGYMVAGIEEHIFSMASLGLCAECMDELRAEMGEFDEDDYHYG